MSLEFLQYAWILLGILLLLRAVLTWKKAARWKESKQVKKTLATITEKTDFGSGQYRLSYVFLNEERKSITGSVLALVGRDECDPGSVIGIYYMVERPERSRPVFLTKDYRQDIRNALILSAGSFVFAVLFAAAGMLIR